MLEVNGLGVQLVGDFMFIRVVSYVIEIWSVEKNHGSSVLTVLKNQSESLTLLPI